uniref:START domain-containing protein 10 n=1 Tax=Cairina moschata TaxID=8855 RepID=A0A8C3BT84_CAIMO
PSLPAVPAGSLVPRRGRVPRMERVLVPDADAFRAFQRRCQDGSWQRDCGGLAVCLEPPLPGCAVHQLKCRIDIPDVAAGTVYDVLHDGEYRRQWDTNVIACHDIARVAANANVGYYAWRCPKPLKNRDVVTLRAWQVEDGCHTIISFSVKHPKYPPRKDLVRAVALLMGYLVCPTGPSSCRLTYLAQVDPKGSLPKWVVNKVSQYLVPQMLKRLHKACVQYPAWKQQHGLTVKPWLYPEQNELPELALSALALQHAASLQDIDESGLAEAKDESGEHSGVEN